MPIETTGSVVKPIAKSAAKSKEQTPISLEELRKALKSKTSFFKSEKSTAAESFIYESLFVLDNSLKQSSVESSFSTIETNIRNYLTQHKLITAIPNKDDFLNALSDDNLAPARQIYRQQFFNLLLSDTLDKIKKELEDSEIPYNKDLIITKFLNNLETEFPEARAIENFIEKTHLSSLQTFYLSENIKLQESTDYEPSAIDKILAKAQKIQLTQIHQDRIAKLKQKKREEGINEEDLPSYLKNASKEPFISHNGYVVFGVTDQQNEILKRIDKSIQDSKNDLEQISLGVGEGKTYLTELINQIYKAKDHLSNNKPIIIDGKTVGFRLPVGIEHNTKVAKNFKKPDEVSIEDIKFILPYRTVDQKTQREKLNKQDSRIIALSLNDLHNVLVPQDITNILETKFGISDNKVLSQSQSQSKTIVILDEFDQLPPVAREKIRDFFRTENGNFFPITISATPNTKILETQSGSASREEKTFLDRKIKNITETREKFIQSFKNKDTINLNNTIANISAENIIDKTVSIINDNPTKNIQLIMPNISPNDIKHFFSTKLSNDLTMKKINYIIYQDKDKKTQYYNLRTDGYDKTVPVETNSGNLMIYSSIDSIGGDFGDFSRSVGQQILIPSTKPTTSELQQWFARYRKPGIVSDIGDNDNCQRTIFTLSKENITKNDYITNCEKTNGLRELVDQFNFIEDQIATELTKKLKVQNTNNLSTSEFVAQNKNLKESNEVLSKLYSKLDSINESMRGSFNFDTLKEPILVHKYREFKEKQNSLNFRTNILTKLEAKFLVSTDDIVNDKIGIQTDIEKIDNYINEQKLGDAENNNSPLNNIKSAEFIPQDYSNKNMDSVQKKSSSGLTQQGTPTNNLQKQAELPNDLVKSAIRGQAVSPNLSANSIIDETQNNHLIDEKLQKQNNILEQENKENLKLQQENETLKKQITANQLKNDNALKEQVAVNEQLQTKLQQTVERNGINLKQQELKTQEQIKSLTTQLESFKQQFQKFSEQNQLLLANAQLQQQPTKDEVPVSKNLSLKSITTAEQQTNTDIELNHVSSKEAQILPKKHKDSQTLEMEADKEQQTNTAIGLNKLEFAKKPQQQTRPNSAGKRFSDNTKRLNLFIALDNDNEIIDKPFSVEINLSPTDSRASLEDIDKNISESIYKTLTSNDKTNKDKFVFATAIQVGEISLWKIVKHGDNPDGYLYLDYTDEDNKVNYKLRYDVATAKLAQAEVVDNKTPEFKEIEKSDLEWLTFSETNFKDLPHFEKNNQNSAEQKIENNYFQKQLAKQTSISPESRGIIIDS